MFCNPAAGINTACDIELLVNSSPVDSLTSTVDGNVVVTGLKTIQLKKGDILAVQLTPLPSVSLVAVSKLYINNVRVVE